MNALTEPASDALDLAAIIEFKWLLAVEGVHVHVERLQDDPAYAQQCLLRAEASAREAVRKTGERLRQLLVAG